jgi:hypothetical protein
MADSISYRPPKSCDSLHLASARPKCGIRTGGKTITVHPVVWYHESKRALVPVGRGGSGQIGHSEFSVDLSCEGGWIYMPDHYSPRLVAQQSLAKPLRESCAPPSESRNRAVNQPEYCWRSGHAHACASRARSRSLISATRPPIGQEVDVPRPFFPRFATAKRGLVSRRIRFQEKRSLFNQHCDGTGYGID